MPWTRPGRNPQEEVEKARAARRMKVLREKVLMMAREMREAQDQSKEKEVENSEVRAAGQPKAHRFCFRAGCLDASA